MKRLLLIIALAIPCFLLAQHNPNTTSSSQEWQFLGSSTIPIINCESPDIAVGTNNIPYVAFIDNSASNAISVMKFNGTGWEYVGQPGISSRHVMSPSIVIDNAGVPYVAYADDSIASGKVVVKKYDGTNWIFVGPVGITPGYAIGQRMVFDAAGSLFLAFWDATTYTCSVLKFNGTAWTTLGNSHFTGITWDPFFLSVTSSGDMFLGYLESTIPEKTLHIMRLEGTIWTEFGTGLNVYSTTTTPFSMMTDYTGLPCAVYQDHTTQMLTVVSNDGSQWTVLGNTGFTSTQVKFALLGFNASGALFVATDDARYANVFTLPGNTWTQLGAPDFSVSKISQLSFCMSTSGAPYIAYTTSENPVGLFIRKFGYPTGVTGTDKMQVRISPNPTTGPLTVDFDSRTSIAIETYDLQGRLLMRQDLPPGTGRIVSLDLSDLSDGIYLMKIVTSEETVIRKIVVEK